MSSWLVSMGLKKAIDPQVEVKKWRRELTKEMRGMEREIRKIEEAEKKSVVECQKLGKAGRLDACKILAKEIVRTRKAKERMFLAKAQLNSVSMQLQTQAAMARAAGCMKKSTEVMMVMNKLVKLPELQKTMMEMSREMERAGLIEEMVGDAMESLDGDEIEDETDMEVQNVVAEITGDLFKDQSAVPTSLPSKPEALEQPTAPEAEATADDLDAMKARLHAL